MMNPFIASLMQQAEQASREAAARGMEDNSSGFGNLGAAMAMLGGGGGFGGGGLFGGDVPSMAPTLASLTPDAPIEPTYTAPTYTAPTYTAPEPVAPPMVPDVNGFTSAPQITPSAPFGTPAPTADYTAEMMLAPTPDVFTPANILEEKARMNAPSLDVFNPANILEEKARMNAPAPTAADVASGVLGAAPVPMAPVMPEGAAPLSADFTMQKALQSVPSMAPQGPGPLGDEPINMERFLEMSGRDLGLTPEQYRQEGVPMPDWGYVKPGPTDFGVNLSPTGWNGTQAAIDASVPLSGMLKSGATETMAELLAGPYMAAQQRFGGEIPILDALAKQGTSRERETPGSAHFQGNALDIDISGFNDDKRLNLLDALTAEGFTDFGIGPGSLHADRRGRNVNWPYGSGAYGGLSYSDAVARINQGRQAYASGNVPAAPEMGGWELTGDASLYPGELPDWLSPGQPSETMMTKGDPTAPLGNYDMTGDPMRDGIISTANALGMDPMTLATIISYETGGSMDPMKGGPTTQWGKHRGLIQFGEPQAKQHGVDFSSPEAALATQLGPDGAIASYFRKSGWKPGMSELDAYSIVNAGGPGLYDRSDANNGGAPGTVRDKVEQQFGYHRNAARDLLRQMYAPDASPRPAARPDSVFSTQAPTFRGLSQGMTWGGGDDWSNPYTSDNMAIFGGVEDPSAGSLYHDWNSDDLWSHPTARGGNEHADYSQMYREFTYEQKPGYVPVGQREGRTVYAAPAPEYIDGKPVSRNSFVDEAKRRNALVPTEDEMRALYKQAEAVKMPTIPNGGGPNDRISFEDTPDGPWYGPKEFYRTNDSPGLPWSFNEMMQNPAILAQILSTNYGGY